MIIWLIVFLIGLGIELYSSAFVSIWVCVGAIVAYVVAKLDYSPEVQVWSFVLVSALLLYFFRPYCVKFLNLHKSRKNQDSMIGQKVLVIADIDNRIGEGKVLVSGMEWRAKSKRDYDVFAAGDQAIIDHFDGIVLVVVPDMASDNVVAEQ